MAIISLKERTTTDPADYEAHKMSDHSKVYCCANIIEPFAVILTVGDQWAANISRSDPAMYAIEGNKVIIPPLSSIVVEVEETLMLPFNVYGTITQKGASFLEEGLMLAAGKVDPSFTGKLQLLIFNSTKTKKTLRRGEEIANILFFRTDTTIENSLFDGAQEARIKKQGNFTSIKSFFKSDMKFTINLIATILTSSLVAAMLTIYLTTNLQQKPNANPPAENQEVKK